MTGPNPTIRDKPPPLPRMTKRQKERLAPLIEQLYHIPQYDRVPNDPIAIPRRCTDPLEIEWVGFLTALFAYGHVPLFNRVIEKILSLAKNGKTNPPFYRYLLAFDPARERPRFEGIFYRFNRSQDIFCLVYLMSRIAQEYGRLQSVFLSGYRENDDDIGPALSQFIAKMKAIDTRPIYGTKTKPYGLLYFFPSPDQGSACKRLNLYLRWMIRPNDGIDFGLWDKIPPSKLIIPLDTHIARIGRYLGLTSRKTADLKMAREITQSLKAFDPVDPVKYDFSLCHLGISQSCPVSPDVQKCRVCPLQPACKRGASLMKK